jgi:hypothetical protein
VLVRPDGFAAWASDTTPNPEEVTRAAATWFGRRAKITASVADKKPFDSKDAPPS